MDEVTQDHTLEFAEWVSKGKFRFTEDGSWRDLDFMPIADNTEELLNIFIKENHKDG